MVVERVLIWLWVQHKTLKTTCFLLVIFMTVILLDARQQYDVECSQRGMSAAQKETEKRFVFEISR